MEEKKYFIITSFPHYSQKFGKWMEKLHKIWNENKLFDGDETIHVDVYFTEYIINVCVEVHNQEQETLVNNEWKVFNS